MLLSGHTFYLLRHIFPVKDAAARFIRLKAVTVGFLPYNKPLRQEITFVQLHTLDKMRLSCFLSSLFL